MRDAGPDLNQALSALWTKFRETNLDRVARISEVASALANGTLEEPMRRSAEREAHKLVARWAALASSKARDSHARPSNCCRRTTTLSRSGRQLEVILTGLCGSWDGTRAHRSRVRSARQQTIRPARRR